MTHDLVSVKIVRKIKTKYPPNSWNYPKTLVEEADYLVTDDHGSRNSWRHDKAYTQHPPKPIEDIDEEDTILGDFGELFEENVY